METNVPARTAALPTDHGAPTDQPSSKTLSSEEQRVLSSEEQRVLSSDGPVLSSESNTLSSQERQQQIARQKRMGPAPFASFEDLSDEVRAARQLDSPDDKNLPGSFVRLPGIREDITPTTPSHRELAEHCNRELENKQDKDIEQVPMAHHSGISVIGAMTTGAASGSPAVQTTSKMSIQPPATPRIDISRASSSSHHDSKDSTPDREIFDGGGEGQSAKLGLGFKEDGAMELRASTEELDFHDPEEVKKVRSRATSPSPGPEENYRKDSQCSDIVLLSISGRTSRLSSIGSQGSGQSRLSNASHLSAVSGHSNLSRCSSPHKMLLETSFCGYKSPDTQSLASESGTNIEDDEIERLLLARKHDPTQAFLAEGIKVEKAKVTPEKVARKNSETLSDIKIKVDKPGETPSEDQRPKMPRKIISKSGVEYIYIPLKGPIPVDDSEPEKPPQRISRSAPATMTKTKTTSTSSQSRTSKSATQTSKSSSKSKPSNHNKLSTHSRSGSQQHKTSFKNKAPTKQEIKKKVVTTENKEEPKYIRIKLKPDHCYPNEDQSATKPQVNKPDSLDLILPAEEKVVTHSTKKIENTVAQSLSNTPNLSPKINKYNANSTAAELKSVSPSPSISRRSSFASLFKSKETISPMESPTVQVHKKKGHITAILKPGERERSRSRSKSRDRESHSTAVSSNESIDSKSKHKSVLSIFKTSKKDKKSDSDGSLQEPTNSVEALGKLEFKFNEPSKSKREKHLEGDSIRIPLHSPTYYETEHKLEDWKNSSQDSQETVIEASSRKNVNVVIEATPQTVDVTEANKDSVKLTKKPTIRQNSTDSQNVTFSTKLGAENEVFSIKFPKQKTNGKDVQNDTSEPVKVQAQNVEIRKIEHKKEVNSSIEKAKPTTDEPIKSVPTSNSLDYLKSQHSGFSETKKLSDQNTKDKRESILSVVSNKSLNLDEDRNNSSESERDSELDYPRVKKELELKSEQDPDREAIVFQQDSFEDELPYVPTTLPQERSAAVFIVPIKQRATLEMKTCPIERPRSTTPTHKYIIPSELDAPETEKSENVEKLKISLPKYDSVHKRTKSADVTDGSRSFVATSLTQSIQGPKSSTQTSSSIDEPPPPLPPKGVQKAWVNFEDIPEKRKPPKRIQTIPSRGHIDVPDVVLRENVVYTYVDPEDCKCECHEQGTKERDRRKTELQESAVQEDELPLLEEDHDDKDEKSNRNYKNSEHLSKSECIKSESSISNGVKKEPTLRTSQCSGDLLMTTSNKSSIISQDDLQSPNNVFPKTS